MKTIVVLLLLMLAGCAPMPGPALIPGVQTPGAPANIIRHTGLVETTGACNRLLLSPTGSHHQFWLNLAVNGGLHFGGCSRVGIQDGRVVSCEYYNAFGLQSIDEHELLHCEGYADNY